MSIFGNFRQVTNSAKIKHRQKIPNIWHHKVHVLYSAYTSPHMWTLFSDFLDDFRRVFITYHKYCIQHTPALTCGHCSQTFWMTLEGYILHITSTVFSIHQPSHVDIVLRLSGWLLKGIYYISQVLYSAYTSPHMWTLFSDFLDDFRRVFITYHKYCIQHTPALTCGHCSQTFWMTLEGYILHITSTVFSIHQPSHVDIVLRLSGWL